MAKFPQIALLCFMFLLGPCFASDREGDADDSSSASGSSRSLMLIPDPASEGEQIPPQVYESRFTKIIDLCDMDVSQFNSDDLILFGEDPSLYDRKTNSVRAGAPEFLQGLATSGATCLSVTCTLTSESKKRTMIRGLLKRAGAPLSHVFDQSDQLETRQYNHVADGLYAFHGTIMRTHYHLLAMDLKTIISNLMETSRPPKRVFYFERQVEMLNLVRGMGFEVPFMVVYRMDPKTVTREDCLKYTLLGEDKWWQFLKQTPDAICDSVLGFPRFLLTEYKPFPSWEGLSMCQALVAKGKAQTVYRAFSIPGQQTGLGQVMRFLLQHFLTTHPPASYSNKFYALEIHQWLNAIASRAEDGEWEDILAVARRVIEPETSINESVRIIQQVARICVDNSDTMFALKCCLNIKTLRFAVFDLAIHSKTIAELRELLITKALEDDTRRRRELYGLVQLLVKLDLNEQLLAFSLLNELSDDTKYPIWLFILKAMGPSFAGLDPVALLREDTRLCEACTAATSEHAPVYGSYLPLLRELAPDRLTESTDIVLNLVRDNVLTADYDYPLATQMWDCVKGFAACGNAEQMQTLGSLLRQVKKFDPDFAIQREVLQGLAELSYEERVAIDFLWKIFFKYISKDECAVQEYVYYHMRIVSQLSVTSLKSVAFELICLANSLSLPAEERAVNFSLLNELSRDYLRQQKSHRH
jgi:hypothetical protein